MKLVIDRIHCDTDKAIPLYTHERTTREELNPRVYLLKKELPYHVRFNKNFWFSQVTVEKYIDDNLVKTYSWLQSVTPEEKEEFLKINNPPIPKEEPEPTPAEKDRKEYMKKYYKENKEKLKARYSSPEYKEKKRKYREEHKEEYNARSRAYYYRHREEKLMKMKEYNKKMQELQNDKINN